MRDIYQMAKVFKTWSKNFNNFKYISLLRTNVNKISLVNKDAKISPSNIVIFSEPNKMNSYVIKKLSKALSVFEEVTGLDQVKQARDNVVNLRNELEELMKIRIKLYQDLELVKFSLSELHRKMEKTRKGEDLYYQFMEEERDLLKLENKFISEFKNVEEQERHKFTHLTMAMKENHEKEHIQQEKSRYLTIYYSVISGVIMFLVGWFLNYKKYSDLKKLILETNIEKERENEQIIQNKEKENQSQISSLNEKLNSLASAIKNIADQNNKQKEEKPFSYWNNDYTKYALFGSVFIISKLFGF